MQQRVDERAGAMAGRGMNDQAGLLVDGKKVVVLKDNGQRDVLGKKRGRLGMRWRQDMHRHRIVRAEPIAGFGGSGRQLDRTAFQQRLRVAAGALQHGGKKDIEARPDKSNIRWVIEAVDGG